MAIVTGLAVVPMAFVANRLVSVHPEDLKFHVELEKHSYCDLKITNNTENHVAFKVKTTSPRKYFVRPNTGVIHPWDSSVIRAPYFIDNVLVAFDLYLVTLQAQREYPPDLPCKDKFLLQSTIVPPNVDVDQLAQDTFNKEGGRTIEERKLKVVYISSKSTPRSLEDYSKPSFDTNLMHRPSASSDDNQALQRLKDERDAAVQQTKQLQKELEILKNQRSRKSDRGASIRFALFVGLIGIVAGWLLNLWSSSPSMD
ncbi:vesicle-associated 2-1 [Olea europaea subsp. europaea]|uniref:Vesicle-associated 2-1 n=1 Tax=Olea europaea subsp. europaea TaxID=158383 RepID=A0A8S0RFF7_OLEEU|nr:vesicle-associated 2-1 [Olea europaea subsp. europaea]